MGIAYNTSIVADKLKANFDGADTRAQSKSSGGVTTSSGSTGQVTLSSGACVLFGSSTPTAAEFGTGPFTVEFFLYNQTSGGFSRMFQSNCGWIIEFGQSKAAWQNSNGYLFYDGQTTANRLIGSPVNQWTHVAFTRDSSNNLRVFYDGVQKSVTITDNVNYTKGTYNVCSLGDFGIGGTQSGAFQHAGIYSNIHFVKGTCKYTSNFTAPTTINFLTEANTSLLTANDSTSLAANDMTKLTTGTATVGSRSGTIQSAGALQWKSYVGSVNTTITDVTHNTSGGYWVFNGTSSLGTFPSPVTSSSPQTYEVWTNATRSSASDGWGYIIHNNSVNDTIANSYVTLGINSSNQYFAVFNGVHANMATNVTPSSSTIVNIVLTWDGTTQKVYINGVLKNSDSLSTTPQNFSATTSFGNYTSNHIRRIQGNIYAMRVYQKALSSDEVLQNFNAMKNRYGY